jgi:hypothetical protein
VLFDQSVGVKEVQAQNVAVVHRHLSSDPDAVTDDVSWHFLSPLPDLVSHYEGRHQAMVEVPQMLAALTAGTFSKRVIDVWPVGSDLAVAHVDVEMTIDGVEHSGSSVIVYRLADGKVVEGFDIPSASI